MSGAGKRDRCKKCGKPATCYIGTAVVSKIVPYCDKCYKKEMRNKKPQIWQKE